MGSLLPQNTIVTPAIRDAISGLLRKAQDVGLTVIDVHQEAERLRSTLPEAANVPPQAIAEEIGREGSHLGLALEFRAAADR